MTERRVGPCGKRIYTSVHDARKAHALCGWRVRVYMCPECKALHVTNTEKHPGRWKGE